MLSSPLELLVELVLCDKKISVPLHKDVPGVNVLLISLPGALENESGRVIGLLGSGGSCPSLPRSHLHQKNHMN